MDELRRFRQFGAKTAGHPERDLSIGIETTTGPLGQGISNAVGMALAERTLAATFNRPGHQIVDHYTYVFVGDGCLMEGISHEVASFAGAQKLGKLIVVYDDNGISIDGKVAGDGKLAGWFADDTPRRFEAYGWHVLPHVDGHDSDAVAEAFAAARAVTDRPSLICAKTIIGWGAPNKQGSASMHGEAPGADEVAAARVHLGWTSPPFEIPADIGAAWDQREKGARAEQQWRAQWAAYQSEFPALAAEFERRMDGRLPAGFDALANAYASKTQSDAVQLATRQSSQASLNAFGPGLPELIGGSADLTPSNGTFRKDSVVLVPQQPGGNYLHFGVREFGMSAILNGLAGHGGFIPYGATFLTFSDYARNALRMAALMRLGVIFVYTHDSIGLGEDGPTHQPIEHLASLRVIPNMDLWRPCDGVETAAAWRIAIEHRANPTCLVFSRQAVVHQSRSAAQVEAISPRRLRAHRQRGAARGDRDRDRFGSRHRGRGGAQARRRGTAGTPRVHAEHEHVRAPGRGLSTERAARRRDAPRCRRGGRARDLVALRRPAWPDRRHRSLRRVGAGEGIIRALWFHGRQGGQADRRGAGRVIVLVENN